jgi:septum formation protein
MIGIEDFRIIAGDGEEQIPPGLSPEQTVCRIAIGKAKNVSSSCGSYDTIIAADTLVYLDGQPMGKPESPEGAVSMLRALSGKMHTVSPGVALLRGAREMVCAEATCVYFRDMSDEEILGYVGTGEPMDKAGAYGAQGRGAVFIERIEGDFFNVMGLPLCRLFLMIKDFGVET